MTPARRRGDALERPDARGWASWRATPTDAAVPRIALLGILGEQGLDLRAHDAEVVGVGR